MSHLLLMQEYHDFGLPVWRFAVSRRESPCIYAPRKLGETETDERSWIGDREMLRAWIRTLAKSWCTVDLGRWDQDEYALYAPRSEQDFHWLCMATATHGGCIEIISPSELTEEHAKAITPIWSTARSLHYLCQTDLCRALDIPWVYLLAIYNYAPCLSVFVSESQRMVEVVVELTEGLEDCEVIPLEQALDTEQKNWEDIYQQFEEKVPLTPEQTKSKEEFRKFREEVERRYGYPGQQTDEDPQKGRHLPEDDGK